MLNARQRSVVIGTLMGDGCLERNGTHVRLKIDHGTKQKEYVEWKFHELLDVSTTPPKLLKFFDSRTSKIYTHWRFATKSTAIFDGFWDLFYNARRKKIPSNIKEFLNTPLALAVWYMDDGYRRRDCKALHLNTQGYTENEQSLLQECLLSNFGIRTKVHWAGKHPKLYIPASEAKQFCEIVKPHMVLSMNYKLL